MVKHDRRRRQPSDARSKFERWILTNGGTARVAEKLGVHQMTVVSWISGRSKPGLKTVAAILKLARNELTVNDLMRGTEL